MKMQYLLRNSKFDIFNADISAKTHDNCHYEHEFNVVYKGNCIYKDSAGNIYNLTPGSLFFIFSGVVHTIKVEHSASMWIMHINPDYLLKLHHPIKNPFVMPYYLK